MPLLVKAPETLLTTLGNGLPKKNSIEGKEKYSWNGGQQPHHTYQQSLKVEKRRLQKPAFP